MSIYEDLCAEFPRGKVVLFLRKVSKNSGSGCWEWNGSKCRLGYGNFWVFKKCWKAHRASYLLHFGKFDTAKDVLHKCDNRGCVNPEHLFLGDHTDNMRDMWSKGRGNPRDGENNCKAKITRENALAIKASTKTTKEISSEFGISASQVRRIARGATGGWQNA